MESLTLEDHEILIRFIIDAQHERRKHGHFVMLNPDVDMVKLKKSLKKLQIELHISWAKKTKK